MRVIVTGSRLWRDTETIYAALAALAGVPSTTITVVHGCASGADAIARSCALSLGYEVEDHWPEYTNGTFAEASLRRNQKMVDLGADLVLAFPTKDSRGTWHCVNLAKEAGIEVRLVGGGGRHEVLG